MLSELYRICVLSGIYVEQIAFGHKMNLVVNCGIYANAFLKVLIADFFPNN